MGREGNGNRGSLEGLVPSSALALALSFLESVSLNSKIRVGCVMVERTWVSESEDLVVFLSLSLMSCVVSKSLHYVGASVSSFLNGDDAFPRWTEAGALPAIPLLHTYPREMKAHVHTGKTVHISITITAAKWKQPKCPSTNKCINKIWYIDTTQYYSLIKRTEVLIHVIV